MSRKRKEVRVLGLVGQGIGYSLSQRIHNFSAHKLGLSAIYLPFDMSEKKLESFLHHSWQMGFQGLNVTQPHKEKVARILGLGEGVSVNTLFRSNKAKKFWSATSTDAQGLEAALKQTNIRLLNFKKIIFLGSGGVVKAILAHLQRHPKERSIHVLKRKSKGVFSISEFKRLIFGAGKDTLIVQATPAPLKGNPLSDFARALKSGYKGAVVDLTYNCRSDLLRVAKQLRLPHQDGLPMLIEQARLAQKLWWRKAASYNDIAQHLKKFL